MSDLLPADCVEALESEREPSFFSGWPEQTVVGDRVNIHERGISLKYRFDQIGELISGPNGETALLVNIRPRSAMTFGSVTFEVVAEAGSEYDGRRRPTEWGGWPPEPLIGDRIILSGHYYREHRSYTVGEMVIGSNGAIARVLEIKGEMDLTNYFAAAVLEVIADDEGSLGPRQPALWHSWPSQPIIGDQIEVRVDHEYPYQVDQTLIAPSDRVAIVRRSNAQSALLEIIA